MINSSSGSWITGHVVMFIPMWFSTSPLFSRWLRSWCSGFSFLSAQLHSWSYSFHHLSVIPLFNYRFPMKDGIQKELKRIRTNLKLRWTLHLNQKGFAVDLNSKLNNISEDTGEVSDSLFRHKSIETTPETNCSRNPPFRTTLWRILSSRMAVRSLFLGMENLLRWLNLS